MNKGFLLLFFKKEGLACFLQSFDTAYPKQRSPTSARNHPQQ